MNSRTKKLTYALAQILGASVAMTVASTPAIAQQATKMERIEVTGSNIRRIDAETALPVQIITKEEITRSGVGSTEQLLANIASISSSGAVQISAASGYSTYGQASVSLRGAGEERTLVLVNGRRLAVFAGTGVSVNINAIPLSAIERVEVLRDGASSIYGTDAVGGVINFILSKDFRGVEISGYYGEPTRSGGGKVTKSSLWAGWGDLSKNRFNISAGVQTEKEDPLFGRERDFANTANRPPYFLGGATETGRIEGVWVPGRTAAQNSRNATTNPFGIASQGYGNPATELPGGCESILMVPRAALGRGTETRNCTFDTGPFVGLIPKRDHKSAVGSLRIQATNNIEVFGEAMYAENKVTNAIQPSPVRQSFLNTDTLFAGSGVDPALLIFPSNPNYPAAYLNAHGLGAMVGQPLAVTVRSFLMGPRTTQDTAKQERWVAGLRGAFRNWDYEFAYTANKSETSGFVIDGYFSQLGLARILNNPASNWNPWAPGGAQSEALNTLLQAVKYVGPTLDSTSKNDGWDGKVSGTIMEMASGPLAAALGFNVREEKFAIVPSPALETGDIAGLGGGTPFINRKRDIKAYFAEVNVPILRSLDGTLSARHDDYSDFGTTDNWKASLRWQPTSTVLLRASAGTGFRAPSLIELYNPQTLGTSEIFVDPGFPQLGQIQVNALIGGNPDLKAEESDQQSIGIVFSPTQNFSVSADFFQIKIDKLIASPTAQEIIAGVRRGDATYAGLVTLLSSGEVDFIKQVPANVSKVDLRGVDIGAAFNQNLGFARLNVRLDGTYMDRYRLTTPSGKVEESVGTLVDENGDPIVASNNGTGGVILRWKHTLAATLSRGPWSGTLTQRFYHSYRDGNMVDGVTPHKVGAQDVYDLQLAWTGIKNLRLAIGALNVFDKDPPIFIPVSNQFQSGYDASMYDPRARFVYVTATYKFDFK